MLRQQSKLFKNDVNTSRQKTLIILDFKEEYTLDYHVYSR